MKIFTNQYFGKLPFPKVGSKEWYKIVNGSTAINLAIGRTGVIISKWDEPRTQIVTMIAFGGVLRAIYKGEWGGYLEYIIDGNTFIIKEGCMKYLFKFDEDIFFIDSLSHMGLNYGHLYKLLFDKKKITCEFVLDLGESVEAITTIDSQTITMISHEYLFTISKVDSIFQKQVLSNDFGLDITYPNSIVHLGKGEYLIGMKGGIAKFYSNRLNIEFYKFFSNGVPAGTEVLQINGETFVD